MIPFLHIGPLTIPTFGLMVATALLVAGYILQADLSRRANSLPTAPKAAKSKAQPATADDGFLIVTVAGIAGLLGARFYHVLETPRAFFADPWPMLFTRYGFAWFGGFLGGFLALIILARWFKIPLLQFFDICAPAAAVGYAIGRMGCLLSGDGDYGRPTSLPWGMAFPNGVVPTTGVWDPESHSGVCSKYGLPENCTVHPTPIYELLIWLAIAAFLWQMGNWALRGKKPMVNGEIFCAYLLLTGIARFLIEFLRINPRSFFGLSNAQAASIVSVLFGAILLWRLKSRRRFADNPL